jgi:hypothetical protein
MLQMINSANSRTCYKLVMRLILKRLKGRLREGRLQLQQEQWCDSSRLRLRNRNTVKTSTMPILEKTYPLYGCDNALNYRMRIYVDLLSLKKDIKSEKIRGKNEPFIKQWWINIDKLKKQWESASATLQSTQWIINAAYNQRSLQVQSTPHYTAWINHQIRGQYLCGAPECLPAFGARTFSTVIMTSVVQDLNEKIAGIDWMMRWLSIALHIS